MIGLMLFPIRRGMSLETLVIKGSEVIRRMSQNKPAVCPGASYLNSLSVCFLVQIGEKFNYCRFGGDRRMNHECKVLVQCFVYNEHLK